MKKSLLTAFLVLLGASNAFAAKGLEGLEPKYALAAAGLGLLATFIGLVTNRGNKEAFISLGIACIVVALVPLVGWVNALVLLGVLAGVGLGLYLAFGQKLAHKSQSASPAYATVGSVAPVSAPPKVAPQRPRPKIKVGNQSFSSLMTVFIVEPEEFDLETLCDSLTELICAIVSHGTDPKSAFAILKDWGSVKIGDGSVFGYGWYLAVREEAKKFANGALVKVAMQVPRNQFITWAELNDPNQKPKFEYWKRRFGTDDEGWNITEYVTTVLRKRFLLIDKKKLVVLFHKTEANQRVIFRDLKVVGIYRPDGRPLTNP